MSPTWVAAQTPHVAVTTVPAKRGSLPRVVEAYGVFGPTSGSVQILSLAEPGRISRTLAAPGQEVARDEPVLEWEQSSASRQNWEQARTALSLAQQQRAHTALLLDRHLATRDQLDQADKTLSDAQAALDALRRAGADQPRRLIRSPVEGILASLPVSQGDYVAAGTTLATVMSRAGIGLIAGVDPRAAPALHAGETASVAPLSGGTAIRGEVLRVGARLDPQTRLVMVELAADGALLVGDTGRAEIDTGRIDGWLVPDAAILQDADGFHLFQATGDKAVRVAVVVLERQGETDLVTGGLDARRRIVVDGAYQLSDGALLREAAR